jgi:hypothetical protein
LRKELVLDFDINVSRRMPCIDIAVSFSTGVKDNSSGNPFKFVVLSLLPVAAL